MPLQVAELRELLKQFGEKPEKLKKAEIIDRIIALTEQKGSPLEKPAYWSQVDPQPSQHAAPPPMAALSSQVADDMSGEARRAQSPGRATRGLSAGARMRGTGEASNGQDAVVPAGVTAYTGEDPQSLPSGEDVNGGWEAGEWAEKEGQSSLNNRPSQDYVRQERRATSSSPAYSSTRQSGGARGGGATAMGRGGVAGAGGGASSVAPKRGPGRGKRLAGSAAYLSSTEMDTYLDGTCVRACMHTYIHTHTHTYTHTQFDRD